MTTPKAKPLAALKGTASTHGNGEPDETSPPETPSAIDAFEAAPVNTKLVAVFDDGQTKAVLMSPDGPIPLLLTDPAHRLPDGARIQKTGASEYTATNLLATDHPPMVTSSAAEAITGFVRHFHDVRD